MEYAPPFRAPHHANFKLGHNHLDTGAHMPIPDYQSIMLPILRMASDGQEHRFRDAVETLADEFGLTDGERAQLLPSGTAPVSTIVSVGPEPI